MPRLGRFRVQTGHLAWITHSNQDKETIMKIKTKIKAGPGGGSEG